MATGQPITAEEFTQMPAEDGYLCELVRGEVRRVSVPGPRHGALLTEIAAELRNHVRANDLGSVFGHSGFKIRSGPDTVRAPDVGFVRRERLPERVPATALDVAPDLAVEIVSLHDRFVRIQEKIAEWLSAGVRVVLLVDATSETVSVHRGPTDVQVLHRGDVFDGGGVVPGWHLDVSALFDILG